MTSPRADGATLPGPPPQRGERLDELEASVPIRDLAEISVPQNHPGAAAAAAASPAASPIDSSCANMDTDSEGGSSAPAAPPDGGGGGGGGLGHSSGILVGGVPVEIINLSNGARHKLDFFDEAQARRFAAVIRILRRVLGTLGKQQAAPSREHASTVEKNVPSRAHTQQPKYAYICDRPAQPLANGQGFAHARAYSVDPVSLLLRSVFSASRFVVLCGQRVSGRFGSCETLCSCRIRSTFLAHALNRSLIAYALIHSAWLYRLSKSLHAVSIPEISA